MRTDSARVPAAPDFRSPAFLRAHVQSILAFYDGRDRDPSGGFFHFYKDDGRVYDTRTRHLVSSTRFVFTQAMAFRHFGAPKWLAGARHALDFVQRAHGRPGRSHAWVIDWDGARATVTDPTQHCYGQAFVLLAHAHALMAGIDEAAAGLRACWAQMERQFWQPALGAYADEADAGGTLAAYRGQNANMHACEATMAAFRATGERHYLDRAVALAHQVTGTFASRSAALPGVHADCAALVWEHFRADGTIDPDFNRDDPANLFRPWGFQIGHQTEWAKLLLQLDRLAPDPAWRPRAQALFDTAVRLGWDAGHGGLVYGIAPAGGVCDGHKYHWVQAESIAAAAWLAAANEAAGDAAGAAHAWAWYDRLWAYAWAHFVDHERGAWYRILGPDNATITDEKSPAGKVDYHDMGACYDVLAALALAPR